MKVDEREEQLLTLEFHVMRNADIVDVATGPGGADRLHHRFMGADALQHRICAYTLRHVFNTSYALISAFRHDIGHAEFQSKLLSLFMTAHGDDSLRTLLFRGEDRQEADGSVAHDSNRHARFHVGCILREPACSQDIRSCEKMCDHLLGRHSGSGTSVPSARGTRSIGACAPPTNSRCWQADW